MPYTEQEVLKIYERHIKMLYRICYSYMKNKEDTEDAIQNTFLRLISKKERFANEEHEKAWLIVTATNLCKDHFRHWWQKTVSLREYEDVETKDTFEIDETLALIMTLKNKYKIVVYLYYYEGYTCKEIAMILHKPQSTIRNYLHDARKILQKKLEVN